MVDVVFLSLRKRVLMKRCPSTKHHLW